MFHNIKENHYTSVSLYFVIHLCKNVAKNPLSLNRDKNKNIKAWPKKRSSYEKNVYHTVNRTVEPFSQRNCLPVIRSWR